LVFYYIGQGELVLLLLIIIAANYIFARFLQGLKKSFWLRLVLLLGVSFNLLVLGFYKYTMFVLSNINSLMGVLKWDIIRIPRIVLPVGISFIIFHGISYLVDVYRKKITEQVTIFKTGFYFAFFPKLITGPITRYSEFHPQILKRTVNVENMVEGIKRFTVGLGKKVLIADSLAVVNNQIFAIPVGSHGFAVAWLGAVGYTLQIYFDFSGYTDMAIGIGKILGFSLPENFNYPYLARSIQDFWKRWHISLARWLQEYLFLPIAYGVLRKMPMEKYPGKQAENMAYFLGTFLTMTLCGLWHGANWTFILWGVYYGLLLTLEHFSLKKILKKLPDFMRISYSLTLVLFGWVLFRSPSVSYALGYFRSMFGLNGGGDSVYTLQQYLDLEIIIFIIIGIIGSIPLADKLKCKFNNWGKGRSGLAKLYAGGLTVYLFFILLFSTVFLLTGTYNPFIYFKF
jgi:alginate O-acetyltransferase complex protein AlgI